MAMLHSWLGNLFPRKSRAAPKSTGQRRHYRPQLEKLEERDQPSVFKPVGAFPPVGDDTQPAFIITFNADGSVHTTKTGQGPFDGGDDTYVGVRNLAGSGVVVTKIHVTSSVEIFGFDDDGFGPPGSYTPGLSGGPFGPTGYEGPGTSFSNANSARTAGDVSFKDTNGSGLQPGFQAFFSLEDAPNAINVTPVQLPIKFSSTVFFPYRPNSHRPSNLVPAWVIFTNTGASFTGNFTVEFSLPGVTIKPVTGTPNHVVGIGTTGGKPSITFSGGLKKGQTVSILLDFTYPPSLSDDAIRKMLKVQAFSG
jgi:hypothetical protein